MLKVNNIDVYYGAIHAIKDVSLEVPDGEIVTLIGSNGAGKSTTLHTISGLIKPKNGSIIFEDKDISGINVGTVKLFRVGKNSRVAVGAHLLDDGVHTPLVLPVGVRAAL